MNPAAVAHALTRWLTREAVLPISLGLFVLAAAGDYLTGVDVAFTLVYLVPIALATWFRGVQLGALFTGAATLSGTLTELSAADAHHTATAIGWNQGGAFVLYLAFVFLLDALHGYVAEEHRQRSLAISQLRHAERLTVIGTLAAGVAHELGTPLGVIQGSAELLESVELAPARRKQQLRVIRDQVARIAGIVSHLLEFGRRGGEGRTLVDASDIVRKTTALMEPIARKADCTLVLECVEETGGATLNANASEIEQVLANLVLNAVQAMPSGGAVRIGCFTERSARRGGVACLFVEDDGEGIRPEDMPKIFDPFFTTKGVGKGTGLGLSVSYGIVDDHGGRIHVRSEVGKGTRFEVRIPLAAD